jgi:hypothetical protein
MDSIFSTEKTILATVHQTGYAQLVDLDLTVQRSGERFFVALRAIPRDGVPRYLTMASSNALAVWTFVIAHTTAHTMTHDSGLPASTVTVIRDAFEKDFGPRLEAWLRKARTPAMPSATTIVAESALVTVDRDVSDIFGRMQNTHLLEYTLFSGAQRWRGILAGRSGNHIRTVEFAEASPAAVLGQLESDELAASTSKMFDNSPSSHHVDMISTVLSLCFGTTTHKALTHAPARA